jgi:hypothetical protein
MLNYLKDFVYGATRYPCALFRPKVFFGYFGAEKHHFSQKDFFYGLITIGFKRTFWQLVFPGQTAGLVKKIAANNSGVNEYHIRFYDDGTIECELEVDRWSAEHWIGPRIHGENGINLLTKILETEFKNILPEEQNKLYKLFGAKNFTEECVRRPLPNLPLSKGEGLKCNDRYI